MYHDQGLIPFKQIAFESGVNFTAGLKFVRTSPDHGTAFDTLGKEVLKHLKYLSAKRYLPALAYCETPHRISAELAENPLVFAKLSRDRD